MVAARRVVIPQGEAVATHYSTQTIMSHLITQILEQQTGALTLVVAVAVPIQKTTAEEAAVAE